MDDGMGHLGTQDLVWVVSGLVSPPALHPQHQVELQYFSNQLILHNEQQETGLIPLL